MKTWFVVTWGINECRFNGPFGDDADGARQCLDSELGRDDDEAHDAGGLFELDIVDMRTMDSHPSRSK